MDRLAIIDQESARFAEVLSTVAADARVPTCPEWDARDLLWHLTEVHLFWAGILSSGARTDAEVAAVDEGLPGRPEHLQELLELRAHATASLIAALREVADDEARWSWWESDQTAGFTRRMQTYEATMHRVDAERTAGLKVTPIADEVAYGAIDHCADVMWAYLPEWANYTPRAVVELRTHDEEHSWTVEAGRWHGTGPESGKDFDEPRAVRAAAGADPDAHFTGTAHDLALWAWGRGGHVMPWGDDVAIVAMQDVIDAGIQ